jgi:hypothetical protein
MSTITGTGLGALPIGYQNAIGHTFYGTQPDSRPRHPEHSPHIIWGEDRKYTEIWMGHVELVALKETVEKQAEELKQLRADLTALRKEAMPVICYFSGAEHWQDAVSNLNCHSDAKN